MKINPKYIIYQDLIGFEAQVRIKSKPDSTQFKEIGTVIDDTKNMLVLERNDEVKRYIKKDHVFRFKLEDNSLLEVNGDKIVGVPENRLRNLRKKRNLR